MNDEWFNVLAHSTAMVLAAVGCWRHSTFDVTLAVFWMLTAIEAKR